MAHRPFELARTRVTLFEALLRARDAKGGKYKILEDHDRKPLSYDDIVRAAFALGGKLDTLVKKRETAGVMLPTGVGCTVTFFALHAIGRTPAMLNFTAGAMNLRSACEAANAAAAISVMPSVRTRMSSSSRPRPKTSERRPCAWRRR